MSIINKIDKILGVEKRFLQNRLKNELKKYDDSIVEMLAYENVNDFINIIVENINPKTKNVFIKKINDLMVINKENLINIAKETKNYDIYNKIKEIKIDPKDDESEIIRSMMNARLKKANKLKIKNIAFSGGGAKGIAHIGTIKKIEEHNINIKAVSGTSAGAITALPYALGYKPDKIAEIVLGYDFTAFLQESMLTKSPTISALSRFSASKRALMYRSEYFQDFVKEFKRPLLKYLILKNKHKTVLGIEYPFEMQMDYKINHLEDHLKNGNITLKQRRSLYGSALETDLNSIIKIAEMKALLNFKKSVQKNEKDITHDELKEKLSLGFKSNADALKTFLRIFKSEDVIEEFFGDLIENKVGAISKDILEKVEVGFSELEKIRNMNFIQFEKLRTLCPMNNFKDIGICICQKESDDISKLFSKENYKQIDVHAKNTNKEYAEMSLKTAVRISMNLPGAFSSYEYNNKKYVDGGVRANFPLHFFDNTRNEEVQNTIGFALAPEENYTRTKDINNLCNPETPVELYEPRPLKRFIKNQFIKLSHFYNRKIYGQKLDNNNPFNNDDLLRIGFINVLKVGTNDFNLSKKTKQALINQGYNTCSELLSPRYNAQLLHHIERICAIKNQITETKNRLYKMDKNNKNKNNENFIDFLVETNYSNITEHLENPLIKNEGILDKKELKKRKKQKC